MSLVDHQHRIRVAVREPVQATVDGLGLRDDITASALTRFAVYRNAFHIRTQDSLAHDFPAVLRAAGDATFGRLAYLYLRDHRPRSPSLRHLGIDFPRWLRASTHADLADLAELDWAILEAHDAADAELLAPESLMALAPPEWGQLVFESHPSVRFLDIAESAWHCWRGNPQRGHGRALALVWRRGSTQAAQLGESEWYFLRDLALGASWDTACQRLAQTTARAVVPSLAAQHLATAISRGIWVA